MVFVLILGIMAFLLMEHTLVFWLVFVPLAILCMLFLVRFFTSRRLGLVDLAVAMIILVAMGIILMIVCIP